MEVVNEICDLLQTHANRDKVVCLACYGLKLWGSSAQSTALMTASGRLAGARAATRLFDDAAAITNLRHYGLGRHEGCVWGALGVCNGVSILAYLQFEKLLFLSECGLLPAAPRLHAALYTGHKLAWSLLAFFGFLRSVRALQLSRAALRQSEKPCGRARRTQAALVSAKFLLDVVHAVSWLPRGWLWGSALSTRQASAAATASALLALVAHYHGKRLAA